MAFFMAFMGSKPSLRLEESQTFGYMRKKNFHNVAMTFGKNLRAARHKKGLSQEQVGEAMEVSRVAVGYWEKDKYMPESDKIPALAKLLGTTPNELYGFASQEPHPVYDVQVANDADPKARIVTDLLASMPDSEVDSLIRNLEEKKQRYDALLDELLKKRRA
jgi:transcriptional regulator with XRE-family HTH domain